MNLKLAKNLIKDRFPKNEIISQSGITAGIYYQLKREFKPDKVDFGCVVCCDKKTGGKGFCSKHYYRYVTKIKGL